MKLYIKLKQKLVVLASVICFNMLGCAEESVMFNVFHFNIRWDKRRNYIVKGTVQDTWFNVMGRKNIIKKCI